MPEEARVAASLWLITVMFTSDHSEITVKPSSVARVHPTTESSTDTGQQSHMNPLGSRKVQMRSDFFFPPFLSFFLFFWLLLTERLQPPCVSTSVSFFVSGGKHLCCHKTSSIQSAVISLRLLATETIAEDSVRSLCVWALISCRPLPLNCCCHSLKPDQFLRLYYIPYKCTVTDTVASLPLINHRCPLTVSIEISRLKSHTATPVMSLH